MTTTVTTNTMADEPKRPVAGDLLALGFIDIARWSEAEGGLAYVGHPPHAHTDRVRLSERNALYAFVRGDVVLYVGKTTRTIAERLAGYRRPVRRQPTNWRCNERIRAALARREEIHILAFTPPSQLQFGGYGINLAAGLEDALIAALDPPWNGRARGRAISEAAEREEADQGTDAVAASAREAGDGVDEGVDRDGVSPDAARAAIARSEPALARFTIVLGEAYYHRGFINPGAAASRHLGGDGEPIAVAFSNGADPIVSRIDRTANRNGSVRLVGRNGLIASWLQTHFCQHDTVEAHVLGANRILLLAQPT